MPTFTTPDSASFQEYNPCHSRDDGRFCSTPGVGPLPSGFLEGSVFKGELFHASNADLKSALRPDVTGPGHEGEYGIYLSPKSRGLEVFGNNIYRVRINIKNPKFIQDKFEAFDGASVLRKAHAEKLQREGYDSIVVEAKNKDISTAYEVIVFDSARVHVTGRNGKYF